MLIHQRILFAAACVLASGVCSAQKNDQTPVDSGVVIHAESRLVLVDAVVTGKKGEYVTDLKAKDFKVWEDNKEQSIKSFAFEADPASPANQQNRYLVLFFDNSTMTPQDQIRARQAAANFIDSNSGPNRMMAVVNFGGALRIVQNFTRNVDRLKSAVSGVQFSAVSPNDTDAGPAGASLSAFSDFSARSVLLGVRSLAKGLSDVPGRKTLVLITAGFPVTQEQLSEVTAAIDACNKANIAVYPIDVRGLVAADLGTPPRARLYEPNSVRGFLQLAAYSPSGGLLFAPQRGGGTTGGTGGGATGGGTGGGGTTGGTAGGGASSGGRGGAGPTTGGSTGGGIGGGAPGGRGGAIGVGPAPQGGGRGASTGTLPGTGGVPNGPGRGGNQGGGGIAPPIGQCQGICNQRELIRAIPESTTTNQQLMYMLADGTGGFVIKNTNDLLGGMRKIGEEQDQHYILGYTPPESAPGSCHVLRVKVDRGGTSVRARSGYCNVKSRDVLTGNPVEKTLEARAAAAQAGSLAASLQVPYFYTATNVARVQVAMDIASQTLKFEKQKGKLHAAINVLGIAYTAEGGVGARFSNTVNLDFEEQKQVEQFKQKPMHYENQFDVASGRYNLKVAFSSGGEQFGKLETPLTVDPFDTKQFGISGLALGKEAHMVSTMGLGLDASLIDDKKTLIADGVQIVPSGSNEFKIPGPAIYYFEIYEPLLVTPDPQTPTAVAVQMRVLDRKTGEQKEDSGLMKLDLSKSAGNPVIAIGQRIPVEHLGPGSYQLELTALDTTGKTVKRTADFEMK